MAGNANGLTRDLRADQPVHVVSFSADSDRGGPKEYAVQLARCLGTDQIFRIVGRRDGNERFWSGMDRVCMKLEDLLDLPKRPLVIACPPPYSPDRKTGGMHFERQWDDCQELIDKRPDAVLVYHDFRTDEGLIEEPKPDRIVLIRERHKELFPDCEYIPHPYKIKRGLRLFTPWAEREFDLMWHTRIDFSKRTHWILEGRPEGIRWHCAGSGNRRYIQLVCREHEPDFDPKPYPLEEHAAVEMAARGCWNADFTVLKGDGEGTQYAFMEAMDAGAIPLIHSQWGRTPFFCYNFGSPAELWQWWAEMRPTDHDKIYNQILLPNWRYLEQHSYEKVRQQWYKKLGL